MNKEQDLLYRVQAVCNDISLFPLHVWTSHRGAMGVFQSKEHGYIGFALLIDESFQYLQQEFDLDVDTLMTQAQMIAAFAGAIEHETGSPVTRQVTLYKQGVWTEAIVPIIPDEVEDWFTYQGYHAKPSITVGVEDEAELAIWNGPFIDIAKPEVEIRTPLYPYCVELTLNKQTIYFYIADEGSYVQVLPHLIDIVQKALQVKLVIQQRHMP